MTARTNFGFSCRTASCGSGSAPKDPKTISSDVDCCVALVAAAEPSGGGCSFPSDFFVFPVAADTAVLTSLPAAALAVWRADDGVDG